MVMTNFQDLLAIAVKRKGSLRAVEQLIPRPQSRRTLMAITDDRWLSDISRYVFRAGFNRKIINNRWPDFEEAFSGFDPHICAAMNEPWFDQLLKNERIIRNAARIRSVQRNAAFILCQRKENNGLGKVLADWPLSDQSGLIEFFRKNADRLGDKTTQYFMREAGKDCYVLSDDVIKRLSLEKIADKVPTTSKQRQQIQDAFNVWMEESGKGPTYISKVLAMSVDSDRIPRYIP